MPTSPGFTGPALCVERVSRRYGPIQALERVSLEIQPGEIVALLGPNGAGKTTFTTLVVGLLRPDAGRIVVNGRDVTRAPSEARSSIGYAPQELGLYPGLSVRENLGFFGALARLRGHVLGRAVDWAISMMALDGLADRRASHLSGGEKRRLHTAAALLHRPRLLMLDEPTAGVDVETRQQIVQNVATLASEGTAVCYCTHYLHEVEQLGARVAVIVGGRVAASGTLAEIKATVGSTLVLGFDGPAPADLERLVPDELAAGTSMAHQNGTVMFSSRDPHRLRDVLLERLRSEDRARLVSLQVQAPTLEHAYLSLTRDAADARAPEREGAT